MNIVILRFAENRGEAGRLMDGHKAWIRRGLEDGSFLLVGSLEPELGGCVIAHGMSRDELEARVKEDPFVVERVVTAEILEVDLARTDERLAFLVA